MVGVDVVSAVLATSTLNARSAMYASRAWLGMYGRSNEEGVSYFRRVSRQYFLALASSAADEMMDAG